MKRLLIVPILLLNACAVGVTTSRSTVTPASSPSVSSAPTVMLNQRAGLPQYPNASLVDLDAKSDGSSRAVFQTGDSIEQVYAFVHQELSARGWARTNLDFKSKATKLEARYARSGASFKLKLDQEGKSGRYKIEVDF